MNRGCNAPECNNKHDSLGFCANHARQYRKYGHPLSKEEVSKIRSNQKIGTTHKGAVWADEARKKRSEEWKGRQLNTGRTHFKKGVPSWNTGMSDWMTLEHREKLRQTALGRVAWNAGLKLPGMQGTNNPMWKSDNVGYYALHHWVRRCLGKPKQCAECGFESENIRQFHWANISHNYERDLDDWIRLCVSCHRAYDSNKIILTGIGG